MMVQPINYSMDVQSPIQSVLQGYQGVAAIRNDQLQAQQQQQQQAQQQALQAARAQAFSSPTADNFARLMALDPKSSEAYQRAWTTKNTQQQQSLASDLLQWGAAIKSGQPQIAAEALTRRADSIEQQNGGQPTQDSQAMRLQARLATEHPEFALGQIQALLAANPNGKDAAETLAKFGTEQRAAAEAPGALRKVNADASKAEADAATAGVTAKFAEQVAVQDLAKKGWDIKKIAADIDIAREANRIAAMNAASTREGNALKREELKLKVQEARSALDEKIRDRAATVESAASTIDNFLNTADRILSAGVGSDGKPNSTLRAATGPVDSRLPTVQTDVANIEALVETLGSQAFLSQIPALKGMGQLSDAEGKKVQAALTNLSLSQGADQLVANVKEAQRLILKARKNIETRHGMPAGVPDTPAVQTPAADIDALVKKYGG
jgi:hypothetical protein